MTSNARSDRQQCAPRPLAPSRKFHRRHKRAGEPKVAAKLSDESHTAKTQKRLPGLPFLVKANPLYLNNSRYNGEYAWVSLNSCARAAQCYWSIMLQLQIVDTIPRQPTTKGGELRGRSKQNRAQEKDRSETKSNFTSST